MSPRKEKIEALIRDAMADSDLSEEARERVDEIHRSAICTAHKIAGHYDQWSVAYEAALYKELQKRQREIQWLRERSGGLGEGVLRWRRGHIWFFIHLPGLRKMALSKERSSTFYGQLRLIDAESSQPNFFLTFP